MQAHATNLATQSQQAAPGNLRQQTACQAHSYQAKALSLEKAAEAQQLHAQVACKKLTVVLTVHERSSWQYEP